MVESLLELDSFRGVTLVPMFASQVVADACVSLALCLALPHDRSGFKQTHNLMLTIIIYIVSRGIVTSVAAMVELLAITIAPHALWFVCAELTIAGLYTNSFLSALNSRNALRKCVKGNATVVSKISIPIAFTNSRAGDDDHGSIHSDRPDPTSQGVKAEFVDYKENAHDEV
ncbi:hypothetical protein BC835DRAFT_394753 [Cytidiella melzeri]|nr:hypothetical protein BC835DRAFT_394753 [Cytidiella melzeri]